MDSFALGSLFLLGFLGSGHCIGMCGPLVLALPQHRSPLRGQLAYHAGRILTYSLVGALLGGLGLALDAGAESLAGARVMQRVARVQLGLALLAAGLLIWFGLTRLGVLKEPAWMSGPSVDRLPLFGKLLKKLLALRSLSGLFRLGLLLGLLPCGLSWAAFVRALPTADPLQGGLLVAAFGLGTLPAMLLVATAGAGVLKKHRQLSELIAGVVMVALGASLAIDSLLGLL